MKKIYAKKRANRLLSNLIPIKMSCLLIASLLLWQTPIHAKDSLSDIKVSVNASNQSVKRILQEIEDQTDMKFVYLNRDVNERRKVSIDVSNSPLNSVLDNVFSGTDIIYEQLGKQILLKKPAPPISADKQTQIETSEVAAITVSGTGKH